MERTHAFDRWLYGESARTGAPPEEFERIAAQYPVFRVTGLEGTHR